MLVLSFFRDQDVVITTPEGRKIVVCVVRVDHGKVRLGFEAEKDIAILRGNAETKTKKK